MTTPNQLNEDRSPEEQIVDLLPLLAANLSPQLGYRLELSNVVLSDIDIATDYKRRFSTLVDAEITNEATFVYTYNTLEDTLDLESIRLGLAARLQDENHILADSVYLQRFQDGFVQTHGLGDQTVADVPISPTAQPEAAVKTLLEPVGLYTLGGGNALARDMASKLDNAEHWVVREQQTIPLASSEDEAQRQLIFVRKRSIVENSGSDRPFYNDDYEIVFQTIFPPKVDENLRPIDELTLTIRDNDTNGRTFALLETEYDRYEHPYVLGLAETLNLRAASHEPSDQDFLAFLKLLEGFEDLPA